MGPSWQAMHNLKVLRFESKMRGEKADRERERKERGQERRERERKEKESVVEGLSESLLVYELAFACYLFASLVCLFFYYFLYSCEGFGKCKTYCGPVIA